MIKSVHQKGVIREVLQIYDQNGERDEVPIYQTNRIEMRRIADSPELYEMAP